MARKALGCNNYVFAAMRAQMWTPPRDECGLSRAGVMNESATAQGSQRARNELLCEVYK